MERQTPLGENFRGHNGKNREDRTMNKALMVLILPKTRDLLLAPAIPGGIQKIRIFDT
jgi:hypothetical protein